MPGLRPSMPLAIAAAAVLAFVLDPGTAPPDAALASTEPSATPIGDGPPAPRASIGQRYIVEVDDARSLDSVVAEQRTRGVDVVRSWDESKPGFAAVLNERQLRRLARESSVVAVFPDEIVRVGATTQDQPPWGLDRIDQRNPPSDGTYSYESTGAGVKAYVVDTGIRSTHVEFTGRIGAGAYIDFGDGRGIEDCNGHGTHVSGTLGGSQSGVAKGVTIVPVKVFDCAGSAFVSDVIAGLNWIIGDHLPGEPAVVNMSLGTSVGSDPLDAAVEAVIADGVTVVAAAGNASVPSCGVSPARVPDAVTVAAIDNDDIRASYSNTGSCNDLFAPGTGVVSAGIASDTAGFTLSGTSMAAPHVAGAVARYLQDEPAATPSEVHAAIDAMTDPGVIAAGSDDPDKILYVPPVRPVCVTPPPGIIGWWTGDGTAAALVGPTLTGNLAFARARVGDGLAFDGSGWLTASGVAEVTSGLTVESWVTIGEPMRVQTLAARWDFPSTDDGARVFALTLQPPDRLVFETDETSARRPEVLTVSVPQLVDGEPHHVAATWDRTRISLFVDGVEIASRRSQGGTLNPATSTPVTIGGQVRGLVARSIVDEPTIYSRALTPSEIAAIHAADSAGKCA